jgi:23S rRNA pseudouridine1911/1915/1917 synthase
MAACQRNPVVSEELTVLTFQEAAPQRLDKFLAEKLPQFSRSRLQTLIKEGKVSVDGTPAHKAGFLLEGGEQIVVSVPPPQPAGWIPEDIPLEVVFENSDLLVVNKPAGMVVHPAAGHFSGTLVHAALAHSPEMEGIGGEQRPGIVHRLDKNTSGLILLAKNDQTHRWLVNHFRERSVKKIYLALVDGKPPTPNGRVETPIGRSSSDRKKMAVVPSTRGREALTEYHTIESFQEHTLLEVHPITGRTHQIRIHMEFLGCPIAGDTIYGRHHSTIQVNRHFLHAARLTIQLPGEDAARTFEAPLPAELENVLHVLRKG